MNNDRLLTLDEVAQLGKVSRRTVDREIKRGRIGTILIGERNVRVRETEARRWAGLSPSAPRIVVLDKHR